MKYSIKYDPSYSKLVVDLGADEKIAGEAGALTCMSPNIDVVTRQREGSILDTIGVARALREFVDWLWVLTSPRVTIEGLDRNPETGGALRW